MFHHTMKHYSSQLPTADRAGVRTNDTHPTRRDATTTTTRVDDDELDFEGGDFVRSSIRRRLLTHVCVTSIGGRWGRAGN